MRKAKEVFFAIEALATSALVGFDVLGLDADSAAPDRIPAGGGRLVIRPGSPGQPEIDLSPLTYNYQHGFPLEFAAFAVPGQSADDVLDLMIAAMSSAIATDRTLGGLVDWIDAYAPDTQDIFIAGAPLARGADATLIASYSTPDPL